MHSPFPRRPALGAAGLGLALLAAVPAMARTAMAQTTMAQATLAQATMTQTPGAAPPPHAGPGTAPLPPGGGALGEMRDERGSATPAPVGAQRRDALAADEFAPEGAYGLLRAALAALGAGRNGEANELIERAETRLLTRSTLPWQADQPVDGGPVRWLAGARAALLSGDLATARREVDRTVSLLAQYRPPAGVPAAPAAGAPIGAPIGAPAVAPPGMPR
ncbi:hypothetical protein M0638_00630 [Roseomonas sp. NAR14]|uniref:Uncharacterized protein n=1 Tax=Roseomonas acroporae TaxID=2937791 RepID=A0A9X1Y2E4_9PROT|nr:hypothetical protein [Roseomonas acroporae]MCK8782884.1 hypothetical protein [Roseomonas acroporae]